MVTFPVFQNQMPPPFGAFHHQTSYIPNQSTMYGQFAYNIPPNPPFVNTVQPTPQTIVPNTNQSRDNMQLEKVKHNLVMGALEQRLGLSQMVTGKSFIVICYELLYGFCITSNQFDMLCSIRFLPNDGAVSRISLIFQSKYDGVWPSWSKVAKPVRDLWFGGFKVTIVTTY